MSLFTDTFIALLAARRIKQVELAHRTGISESVISRILAGREPMPEQVSAICACISDNKSERAELFLAWLRDCAVVGRRAGLNEAELVFRSSEPSATDGTIAAELGLLADEAEVDEDLRETLKDLARMVRSHRAREADAAAGAVYPFRPEAEPIVAEPPAASPRRRRSTPPVPKPPAAG